MKSILVIGPSGVGKSTLAHSLSEADRTVITVSFDEHVKELLETPITLPIHRSGEEGHEFWLFCKGIIDHFTRINADTDLKLIFDVDAGAEYVPECRLYLMEHAESVICVMAEPEIVYQREIGRAMAGGHAPRTEADFMAQEFSPAMRKLYDSAAITIDTSYSDVNTSLDVFRQAVYELSE